VRLVRVLPFRPTTKKDTALYKGLGGKIISMETTRFCDFVFFMVILNQ
jgi:hypothetical protein